MALNQHQVQTNFHKIPPFWDNPIQKMWIWGSFYVTLSVPFTKEPGGTDKDGIKPLYFQLGPDFWAFLCVFGLKVYLAFWDAFFVCVWHFDLFVFFWLDGVFSILKCLFCVFGLMVCLAFWNAFSGNLSFCRRRDCQFLHRSKMKLDAMPILFSFFSTGQDQTGWKANTFLFLFNRIRSSWMKSQ